MVCVSSCPSTADYTQFYCMDDNQAAADAAVAEGYNLMTQNVCMVKIKTTQGLYNLFVFPTIVNTSPYIMIVSVKSLCIGLLTI